MTDSTDEHRRLIVDQFTQQAVPFSQMRQHSPELILAASEVGPDDTVLDVACGPGLMTCEFANVARHVTGLDLTVRMIEQARELHASKGHTNASVLVGDIEQLPLADSSFTVVFTRYALHHALDPRSVLTEMVRVCSPGGRVVVVDVYTTSPEQAEAYNRMEKLRDPSHVRALSLQELTNLFHQAGLHRVSCRFYRHAFELEQVLQGSFPGPGDADRVREMFTEDLNVNRMELGACRHEGEIHFAYPIAIVAGRKPDLAAAPR